MSSSTTTSTTFDDVIEALKDVHDEATLWHLSDELVKVAPSGVAPIEAVVKEAQARGIPTKSANTLRLYRDVAHRFPANERIPLVSFSAHREAIAIGDVKQARQILVDLASKHGAVGVTVTTVKGAVQALTGKVPAVKPSTAGGKAQSSFSDVAVDLSKGGKKFLAELSAMLTTPTVTLDGLAAGLAAVLTEVESRRAKAARKAAASKAKPAAPRVGPSQSPAARKAVAAAKNIGKGKPAPSGKATPRKGGKAGDLRDL